MFYQVEPLFPGLTRIWDVARTAMYLVEGADKAVLIDTGVGVGDLKSVVAGLTDKPVTLAIREVAEGKLTATVKDEYKN